MPAYRIGVYIQMLLQQLPVALPDLLWQFMQRLLQFLKKFRGGGNGKLPSVQLRRSWTCLLQLSQENTVQKLFFREQGGKGKIGPRWRARREAPDESTASKVMRKLSGERSFMVRTRAL